MGIKKTIKGLPDAPGVYLFKDKKSKVLYIGKASSIKKRVSSYFQRSVKLPRTELLVSQIKDVDFIPTRSEAEALIYEASMVRTMRPKYNVELKDDKSYPYLKLTKEEYPRLMITRRRVSDGSRYFGPYTNVKLLKQALSYMKRVFPLRTCNRLSKKICLAFHIGECTGPCERKTTKKEYNRIVRELILFLEGKRTRLLKDLSKHMRVSSKAMDYETAAKIRDRISALSVATDGGVKISGFDEVEDLKNLLNLRRRLRRIDAFDISNISGVEAVGSMVVFVNGEPEKAEYRKYKIRTVEGINDYAMMKEVVTRRYKRALEERLDMPDLIIIDGGRGHLNTALEALKELGFEKKVVIGIAKEFERIWLPGKNIPLILHKNSPVLHLIQRIRDEAHRFAHSYFRLLRRKRLVGGANQKGIAKKRRTCYNK